MKNVAKILSFVAIAGIGLAAIGCDKPAETKKPTTTPPPAPSTTPEKK
ncbi:MAG: hypothetical protein AABZ53_17785 [Planctomycetota bacterium]